jgi:Protein of unknown function (DUF4235)
VQRVLLFPLSMLGGLFATMIGRKVARRVWATVDDEALPAADRRDVSPPRLVAALALEGAIFGIARGVTDRGLRRAVEWVTGGRTPDDDDLAQAELEEGPSVPA